MLKIPSTLKVPVTLKDEVSQTATEPSLLIKILIIWHANANMTCEASMMPMITCKW